MMETKNAGKPDYDFILGFFLVIFSLATGLTDLVVFVVTGGNLYLFMGVPMVFFGLFAPAILSEMFDPLNWTFNRYGKNLWSVFLWILYSYGIGRGKE